MIAGREIILGSLDLLKNCRILIHFDNTNAALIYGKGSPKFRLHKYAIQMDDLALKHGFQLKTSAIPRSLNHLSDSLSKCVDLEDYGVTEQFYSEISEAFGIKCNFDRFANSMNSKCLYFNSASICVGTNGVDSFNYNWGPSSVN